MVPWIQVFLDTPAASFDEAVDFWASVTGWQPSERRGEDGQFLTLLPPTGAAYVKLQAVDPPVGIHLDLDTADRPAAIERARGLGATTAWTYHDVEVMRSPGGFVFCQTRVDRAPGPGRAGLLPHRPGSLDRHGPASGVTRPTSRGVVARTLGM